MEKLIKKANILFKAEKPNEAERILRKILKKDPLNTAAFKVLSKYYIRKKQHKKIVNIAYNYLKLDFNFEVGNLIVSSLLNLKQYRLAYLLLGKLIDIKKGEKSSTDNLKKIKKSLLKVKDKKIPPRYEFVKSLLDENRNRATVSLCMIVKDEEKNLASCLKSAEDVVSEIIIVDTGSKDRTKEIAKDFGAIVKDFTWEDDFAKARNESIKYAKSDYVMFMDADERLDKSSYPFFKKLKKAKNPVSYFAKVRSLTDKDNIKSSAEHYSTRLWLNNSSFKFKGKVHETLVLTDNAKPHQRIVSGITIIHRGYLQDMMKERNKFERNLKLLKQAIKDEPDNPFHEYNIAVHYKAMGKTKKALKHFDIMADKLGSRKTSYLPFAFSYRASCFNDLGLYDKAIESAKKAIAINPRLKDAYFGLANAEFNLEKYRQAIEHFKKVIEKDGDEVLIGGTMDMGARGWKSENAIGICYMKLDDFKNSLKFFKDAYDGKKDSAIVLKNLLTAYMKVEKDEKIRGVIKSLDQKFTVSQTSELANKLLNLEKSSDAIYLVDKIKENYDKEKVKKDADGKDIRMLEGLKAELYYKQKLYKKADKYYCRFFENNLKGLKLMENWGLSNLALKKFNKAEKIFETILESKKDRWSIYHNLGTAKMSLKKIDGAIKCFNKVLEAKPNNVETLFNLGKIYIFKKQYSRAEEMLKKALEFDQKREHEKILYYLGNVLYLNGKFNEATEYLADYLHQRKEDAKAYNLLGLSLYKMGDYEESLLYFSEAIEKNNKVPSFFINLGNSLKKLQRLEDAKNAFLCALMLDKNNRQAKAGMESIEIRKQLKGLR